MRGWRKGLAAWAAAAAAATAAVVPGVAAAQAAEAGCPPVAEAPTAEVAAAAARDAQDRGFLWRIGRDGDPHRSYLYGTVHVAKLAWSVPGPRVARALRDSDTIALELDLLDPAIQRRMASALARHTEPPLPASLAERLAKQAERDCVPAQALAGMGALLQVATLTSLAGRRDGLDPAYGIDLAIAGWAHGAGKPTVSLETPELQLDTLAGDDTPLDQRVGEALDELESGKARPMLVRLTQLWAESDDVQLARYAQWCECLETEAAREAMRRMVDDRNPALADGIDRLHRRGQAVFAAVGALHMVGPRGLPALLAQRGYRVERIGPRKQGPGENR